VRSNRYGPLEVHDFVEFQLGGYDKRKPTADKQIALAYDRALPDFERRGYYAKRLVRACEKIGGLGNAVGGGSASDLVRSSVLDERYLNLAMRRILATLLPDTKLPDNMKFRTFQVTGGYAMDTNISFSDFNREYHKRVPPEHSSLSRAFLLDFVWQSALDLNIAARYGSELLTSQASSGLVELRVGHIFQKVLTDAKNIQTFSTFVLKDGRSIKEAINSGERTFAEFRDVLLKSKKFREWINGINPDADILKEYHRASVNETWADKLPAKSVRFSMFSAAGVALDLAFPTGVGTALGLGLAGTDSFILDRIIRGWKPSHFIDEVVEDFVGRKD
jgi:hypothetical protein